MHPEIDSRFRPDFEYHFVPNWRKFGSYLAPICTPLVSKSLHNGGTDKHLKTRPPPGPPIGSILVLLCSWIRKIRGDLEVASRNPRKTHMTRDAEFRQKKMSSTASTRRRVQ